MYFLITVMVEIKIIIIMVVNPEWSKVCNIFSQYVCMCTHHVL